MADELSFDLHRLTRRLDRVADRILRSEYDLSYRRFLALYLVRQLSGPTQRELAESLDVTEPSVSRMVGVLVEAGYLDAGADAVKGNRRRLGLTPAGKELVEQCHDLLEQHFAQLVEHSGVSYNDYSRNTLLLLATLDGGG